MIDIIKYIKKSENILNNDQYKVVWDLKSESSELYKLLEDKQWVGECFNNLFDALPVAKSHLSFEDDVLYRPHGHSRACYLKGPEGEKGCIAIKGSEVGLVNFQEALEDLLTVQTIPAFWHHNAPDYFVLLKKHFP